MSADPASKNKEAAKRKHRYRTRSHQNTNWACVNENARSSVRFRKARKDAADQLIQGIGFCISPGLWLRKEMDTIPLAYIDNLQSAYHKESPLNGRTDQGRGLDYASVSSELSDLPLRLFSALL